MLDKCPNLVMIGKQTKVLFIWNFEKLKILDNLFEKYNGDRKRKGEFERCT